MFQITNHCSCWITLQNEYAVAFFSYQFFRYYEQTIHKHHNDFNLIFIPFKCK